MEPVAMRTRSKRKTVDFEGLPSPIPRKRARLVRVSRPPMKLNYDVLTDIADLLPDKSRLNLCLANKSLYYSNRRRSLRDNFFEWKKIWGQCGGRCRGQDYEHCALTHAILHDNAVVLEEAIYAIDCRHLLLEMPRCCMRRVIKKGIRNTANRSLRFLLGGFGFTPRNLPFGPAVAFSFMLETALECDNIAAAQVLIDHLGLIRFDVNGRVKPSRSGNNDGDDNRLSLMQRARSAAMVRLLANHGISIDLPGAQADDVLPYEASTALHWHCKVLRTPQSLVEALIASSAEVDQVVLSFFHHAVDLPAHHRATALNLVSSRLNLQAMRVLLRAGADVGGGCVVDTDHDGQWCATTPLHDVLDQAIRGPGKCLWRYHLIAEAQEEDIYGKQDALEASYPDSRFVDDEFGFGCPLNLCGHHPDPSPLSNLRAWSKQVDLLSQRMLAAVVILLSYGAHNFINVSNDYQKTPLVCLIELVSAILCAIGGHPLRPC